MTKEKKNLLAYLLYEYSDELTKKCNYDCYNCELGILETPCSSNSCAIDTVTKNLEQQPCEVKEKNGLYPKYTVINNQTGVQVSDCFILKPNTDEAARMALLYYADICGNEQLANDIKIWLEI